MKKFENAEIEVLSLSETANGILPGTKECGWGIIGHHECPILVAIFGDGCGEGEGSGEGYDDQKNTTDAPSL